MERRKLTKEDIDKVRDVEGFPLGTDEDIIALSDAPYYTACPNPFIGEFIEKYGHPYDEETDTYHCEPFASDISEGKGDAIYNMHTYHTKVPPKAILRYILHYSKPGDIIYDAFAGSGMTGVAAAMASNQNYTQFHENTGIRYCILNDISPAASMIDQGYNYPSVPSNITEKAQALLNWIEEDFGWAYETHHTNGSMGKINYVVWSDVFICPKCGEELSFYDIGIDKKTGHKIKGSLRCPNCGYAGSLDDYERARTTVYDAATNGATQLIKEVPVLIDYSYQGQKYKKTPDEYDLQLLKKIEQMEIAEPYPKNPVPDGYNTSQPKNSHLVDRIDKFYTKRSLISFAKLWNRVMAMQDDDRNLLLYWLQSVAVGFTKTNRYFSSSYSQVNRYLKGTLYIAPVRSEVSPWYALSGKAAKLTKLISNPNCRIGCMSSEKTTLPENSIDYIFIDPPFGANIMYSDLNIIWESWLRVRTNKKDEAIINEVDHKDAAFYQNMMLETLRDCYRILKPNRWITIEFHNSQNYVWNILQSAIYQAGFMIADVRILDKKGLTMKQYSTQNSVDKDLVISAYKPTVNILQEIAEEKNSEETIWPFIRQHLEHLPVAVDADKNGKLDIIPERKAFLLFDRMVAWHLMHGVPVPMDASEFYQGLDEHFLKRDDMYFLPDQVNEYDQKRSVMELENVEMAFAIQDEKGAIQWLNYQLTEPQTYQDLQPKYLQELHQLRSEKMPELMDLLHENFLQDEDGKWYVPDITKAGDVAKLRQKSLLKEFESYLQTKGKLKVFRSEAIRAGFDKLWKEQDYKTIVSVAERLPEKTIQEDANLLMYYDLSTSRV